jgi:hypothetical protein
VPEATLLTDPLLERVPVHEVYRTLMRRFESGRRLRAGAK